MNQKLPLPPPGQTFPGRSQRSISQSNSSIACACRPVWAVREASASPRPHQGTMSALKRASSRKAEERSCSSGPERGQIRLSIRKNKSKSATWWKWLTVLTLTTFTAFCVVWLWDYLHEDDFKEVLARQAEVLDGKFFEVPCSKDYENYKRFAGCTPTKCGRAVKDTVVDREEAERMLRIAKKGLSLGGSDGGASILDLHSGALSMGKQFVNIYRYFVEQIKDIFDEEDFALYSDVRWRIQQVIAETFGLDSTRLHLTKPTFFSRMNNTEAKTMHDEYWHPHIDKVTYGSFDYTSLLYLSDYRTDFGGGRFVFVDELANRTVEPRIGRVSFFTSGSENLHYVEKVEWGTRYAITVSFSCDPAQAIEDPSLP
ncbi:2-oxoglutarate and iron-dependent oxygenase domain-containing protein 3 isoform X2 [Scyliorhinus torazame]|uniref:2-oxoglutarate and iron-dependent oxygenase domain-containing protein 3 isoform X2 n=1 Tax=Scyliorhinus torazame TaxID=75743 RepID=UPI003B5A44C6